MLTISQLISPFFAQFGMTDALYCAGVLVTSNSNCCSVEGLGSHVSPLINTELTATSFHLTEWSLPGRMWRTQKLTLSPQILSLSPKALWPSRWSRKCSDKKMFTHQVPTCQHCLLHFNAAPTWWTHFLWILFFFFFLFVCLNYVLSSSCRCWYNCSQSRNPLRFYSWFLKWSTRLLL